MNNASGDQLSTLLVCPPGLSQVSLVTAVNAFSWATVIARAKDVDTALAMTREFAPDVILTDAYYLGDVVGSLLKRVSEINPKMLLVVLASTSLQKKRLLDEGAHLVLDYNDLTRQFPKVLSLAQSRFNDNE